MIYISCKLTPNEQSFAAIEHKAPVLKQAMEELQYYVAGRHVHLDINHTPLQWMARNKDTNIKIT